MKSINLDALSYKHRYDGASLLISKANRLCGMVSVSEEKPGEKALVAAVAYYDMALALMKPSDPNYPTVMNWKCNALRALQQHDEAADWYEEIIRISRATDGNLGNATAELAKKMLLECRGRGNAPLGAAASDSTVFDTPPYCMYAEEFCVLLTEKKFKKAHACLSPELRQTISIAKLKTDWEQMTGGAGPAEIALALQQNMVDWPARQPTELGWCYFSVCTDEFSEGVAVVVGQMPQHAYWITRLELGRP